MKLLALLFAPVLAAQTPKPGSVEGLVVNSATKAPVAKANVTLHNTQKGFAYAAVTDAGGKFQFPSVEPGATYTVTADAPGFTQNSAHRSKPFPVAEDQKVTGVTASLIPSGAISGRLSDVDGDPVSGAPIQVLSYGYQSGARQPQISGGTETDDRGEYRLSLLPPGRYYVLFNTRQRQADPAGRMHRSQPELDYTATFYPAARDIAAATPIDLPPGGDIGGIDLHIRKIQLFHIRGKIAGSQASQNQRAGLSVTRCEPGERGIVNGNSNATVSLDGSFDVPHMAPGSYCVSAQLNMDFAYRTVTVSDHDLDNVTLTLAPAFQVKGSLVVEGPPLDKLQLLRIMLAPVDTVPNFAASQVQADGSFLLKGALAMSYSVQYGGLPANVYVKSIGLNGRDMPDGRISLASGADTLTVVVATDSGQVTGSLRSESGDAAAGVTVVVAPAGESPRHDRARSAFTDANGSFTVIGLAPGDYKAFAFEEIDILSMQSPEYRQPFESMGTSVTVHPNGRETVDTKVISAGQAAEALSKLR